MDLASGRLDFVVNNKLIGENVEVEDMKDLAGVLTLSDVVLGENNQEPVQFISVSELFSFLLELNQMNCCPDQVERRPGPQILHREPQLVLARGRAGDTEHQQSLPGTGGPAQVEEVRSDGGVLLYSVPAGQTLSWRWPAAGRRSGRTGRSAVRSLNISSL